MPDDLSFLLPAFRQEIANQEKARQNLARQATHLAMAAGGFYIPPTDPSPKPIPVDRVLIPAAVGGGLFSRTVRSAAICAMFFLAGWLCGGCDDVTQEPQPDAAGVVALPPTQPPPGLDLTDAGVDADIATHPPFPQVPACVPVCLDGGP